MLNLEHSQKLSILIGKDKICLLFSSHRKQLIKNIIYEVSNQR